MWLGEFRKGRKKAAHLFLGAITVKNAHAPAINSKRPAKGRQINIVDQMKAGIHLGLEESWREHWRDVNWSQSNVEPRSGTALWVCCSHSLPALSHTRSHSDAGLPLMNDKWQGTCEELAAFVASDLSFVGGVGWRISFSWLHTWCKSDVQLPLRNWERSSFQERFNAYLLRCFPWKRTPSLSAECFFPTDAESLFL